MIVGTYVVGPVFVVKTGDQLPPGALTVSHCLAAVAPDTWALEWVDTAPAERNALAAECGISPEDLPEVVAWATDRLGRTFGWPHVFLELDAALEFRRRFLPDGFRVLQIALPEDFVASFLAMAAPPPQQPGYAPNGETGVYEALFKQVRGVPAGERRGFEVLGYDRYGGGFHSFRCNALEVDFVNLGTSFNQWGLIDDEAQALKCAEWANSPAVGTLF
jgi:hypothetical protein